MRVGVRYGFRPAAPGKSVLQGMRLDMTAPEDIVSDLFQGNLRQPSVRRTWPTGQDAAMCFFALIHTIMFMKADHPS